MLSAVNGRGWMKACGEWFIMRKYQDLEGKSREISIRPIFWRKDTIFTISATCDLSHGPWGQPPDEWLQYRSAFIVVFLIGKGKSRLHRYPLTKPLLNGNEMMAHDPSRNQ
jgi:hypothetical protein